MLRSLCLSSTSVLLLAGCPSPSPTCGTGGVTTSTLAATASGNTAQYGAFVATDNNDCPAAGAPAGVVSVTLRAPQTSPAVANKGVTFCLPRPDLVNGDADATLTLGTDLQVVDISGGAGTCTWKNATAVSGTVHLGGFCGVANAAGYSLDVDATATVTLSCTGNPDQQVTVTLSGSAPGS